MKTNRLPPGIICPTDLARLVAPAPDRELLLTAKLSFHYFFKRGDLPRLSESDFWRDEEGNPVDISASVRCGAPRSSLVRVERCDQQIFRALLPASGSLFVTNDPYGRLLRFAQSIGLSLSPNCAWRSAVTYAFAAGHSAAEVAVRAGMSRLFSCPRRLHRDPELRACAVAYWKLPFDLDRIERLPRLARKMRPALAAAASAS